MFVNLTPFRNDNSMCPSREFWKFLSVLMWNGVDLFEQKSRHQKSDLKSKWKQTDRQDMESFTREKVQQRTHFRFDKSRLWRKIILMERDSEIAICRESNWMDRSFSSATCVNLFADFDNETENRLKLGSEKCLGEHTARDEKKRSENPSLENEISSHCLQLFAASRSLWFIRCATFPRGPFASTWTSAARKASRRWAAAAAADYGHATNQQGGDVVYWHTTSILWHGSGFFCRI